MRRTRAFGDGMVVITAPVLWKRLFCKMQLEGRGFVLSGGWIFRVRKPTSQNRDVGHPFLFAHPYWTATNLDQCFGPFPWHWHFYLGHASGCCCLDSHFCVFKDETVVRRD